ncbi:C-X-C chemokine receptor type 3.1 [Lepisosteus oculatus]|uniref:C-X-C chemokine receptor type 3.1 n=1 Tax=Lepisosteus oculatus TaxID=7918 RepID=UPI0037138947
MDSSDSMDDGGKITLFDEDLWSLFDNDTENNTYDDSCCEDMGDVCTQGVGLGFQRLFLPALYSVALVLGVLGNGLVIAVLCQFRRGWSVTDTFILNLALADTLLVVTLPFWAAGAVRGWIFGTGMCKILGTIFKVNFFCGIFLLACISLDRYLSIVHAVHMYSRRKPWAVRVSCLCVWTLCFLLAVPDLLFLEALSDNRRGGRVECSHNYLRFTNNSSDWRLASRAVYHVMGFFAPSLVMVYCYACILLTLRKSQGAQKQKAIRIILALVVAFFLCWTPYNLTLLADTLHSQSNISDSCGRRTALDISLVATSSLGYLHCCLNPILYAFVGVKFRRNLLELLRALGCKIKGHARPKPASSSATRRTSMWSESGDVSYSTGI